MEIIMMLKHKNKMASACILSIVVRRTFHAAKLFFLKWKNLKLALKKKIKKKSLWFHIKQSKPEYY